MVLSFLESIFDKKIMMKKLFYFHNACKRPYRHVYRVLTQGSTNVIFACTDFRARNGSVYIFVHVKWWVHKTMMVGANLHHLIYNLLIATIFSRHFLLSVNSKKYQSRKCSTQSFKLLYWISTSELKIDQSRKSDNKNYQRQT